MGFVYDYGGQIATQYRGKWVGTLDRPAALTGLAAYKAFFQAASQASKTTIETRPNPYDVYAQGNAASMIGPSWFSCCVGDNYKAATAQFVMPGHVKGQPMPGFLGGSDLAVPVTSSNKNEARRLDQGLHRHASEKALQAKGNIPNATNLLGTTRQRACRAAQLVRPDGEALGRRRERQHPPQHARPDPDGQAVDQAGRQLRERQHRLGSERLVAPCRKR